MKKRYYLSMLSVFPLILTYDCVYFVSHQSLKLFLTMVLPHFAVYGLVNFFGTYFLYKPIDYLFIQSGDTIQAKKQHAAQRINHLTWYSTGWIFFIGTLNVVILLLGVFLFQGASDIASMDKMPPILFLNVIPSSLFTFAIHPALIAYFLINDFNLDLKAKTFLHFQILYPAGKKRIGLTLLFVFLILVFFPNLIAISDLVIASIYDQSQYLSIDLVETLLNEQLVIFIGMIFAVVFITRSFTKPIYSLLKEINKVREGDYSTQAAIITDDEIGVLTKEFNEMVKGLEEREFIRDTFGKYVTKDVAAVILDQKINLEGQVRVCTILVTDIANYTTISEELTPQEIVMMLNEYFSVLVNIIQDHRGVVNKFVGDAIFAMFNVPLDDPDHAVNAIKAALAIEKITATRKFGKNHPLVTRVGINTGVIVAGNIGSVDRMEYTVIGDEVNVAARLEQLNKQHGTHVLLGENTYNMAKNHFDFIPLGSFQLKGKEKTIKVYTIDN
ncbi:MAG: adenylate/guanylate cyclase domain-containing protein [Chloroflexi bacterium]|nr:adenylate/guanylate cyclase domain-containing protein [Chloroflexota bacterium]